MGPRPQRFTTAGYWDHIVGHLLLLGPVHALFFVRGISGRPQRSHRADPRPAAAAVRAMASGSQHSTMARISHRIAVSGSVTPKTAATYWIGAAADATVLPRAATLARSVCSAATQSTRLAA